MFIPGEGATLANDLLLVPLPLGTVVRAIAHLALKIVQLGTVHLGLILYTSK
jgi:hypothetical protein